MHCHMILCLSILNRYHISIHMPAINLQVSYTPVSYTHLDVYKRQQEISDCLRKMDTPVIGHIVDDWVYLEMRTIRTVSYTHLDVYKRQRVSCARLI